MSRATSPGRCSPWRAASTSSCTDTADRVEFGVSYWSGAVGPYHWHDFNRERTQADLASMSRTGAHTVRVHLPWDVFMPRRGHVPPQRLRDLETFLRLAEGAQLRVTPVLFAQSFGDCLMLPTWAIDVSAPRRGVRVLTDAVVQPGGPRDQYTDPVMLEASLVWFDTLLNAFAGHAAISAWDLGHDPATTLRPRRIAQLESWMQLVSAPARERNQRCLLTLGAADVFSARGVRLQPVSEVVDALGLALEPAQLRVVDGRDDVASAIFAVQLAERLAGGRAPLLAQVVAGEHFERRVNALASGGCAAVFCAAWSDVDAGMHDTAPFDQHPELGHRGLVDEHGALTIVGEAWRRVTAAEHERRAPTAWPEQLDVSDYYANLPESASELYAAWTAVERDNPDMLG